MSNRNIRPVQNGYEFDYGHATYRVWRNDKGRIVYKRVLVFTDSRGHRTITQFPKPVDSAFRRPSAFCDVLFSCAAMIEDAGCVMPNG